MYYVALPAYSRKYPIQYTVLHIYTITELHVYYKIKCKYLGVLLAQNSYRENNIFFPTSFTIMRPHIPNPNSLDIV